MRCLRCLVRGMLEGGLGFGVGLSRVGVWMGGSFKMWHIVQTE